MRSLRAAAPVLLLLAGLAASPVPPAGAADATLRLVKRWDTPYGEFHNGPTTEAFSSAAVGDVSGDGQPDVVVGGSDGYVYAFSTAGARQVFLAYDTGSGAVSASPALVDLDRDGTLDILAASQAGRVVGLTGGGDVVFSRYDQRGFPSRGFFGTPTAGDLDGDGDLEVVATSWDHHVHAWDLAGRRLPGFPVFVHDTIWSSPALADLDRDRRLEIVFGGDMDAYAGAPYPAGGLVWAIRWNGAVQRGFPRSLPGQVIWSSPAVTDLDLDGRVDIVVGTGLQFADPAGRRIYALDSSGRDKPGWPQGTAGQVMGSPAVGDLAGDARPEVAVLTSGGWVEAHDAGGNRLWRRCNTSSESCTDPRYATHGSVSVADVDGDGAQEVVSAAEHWLRVLDGATGAIEAEVALSGQVFAPPAAPTIAAVGGSTWIVQHATLNTNGANGRGVGDTSTVFAYTTDAALGQADWPTFHQNRRRTGALVDSTGPDTTLDPLPSGSSTTRLPVTVSATDRSGVSAFYVEVREGSGPWVRWVHGRKAPASGPAGFTTGLHGAPGAAYTVRARASDRLGNLGPWATETGSVDGSATRAAPFLGAYAVATSGTMAAVSSPPRLGPSLSPDLGRDVALRPDGTSGYVLSGDGRLTAFGGAPAAAIRASWPGRDVARAVALNPDGRSGYVLEATGRLRPFGGAATVASPSWPDWDIARDLVLAPGSTAARPAGYVLDGLGGVHAVGAAPRLRGSASWRSDQARGLTLEPGGTGGQVVDAAGGLHPFGAADDPVGGPSWPGRDRARAVAALGAGTGYVLDANGGVHPYGGAPAVEASPSWRQAVARGLALVT